LGIEDAEHEESAPGAPTLFISRLACSLAGKTQTIKMTPDSRVHQAYGRQEATEQFHCNYGLNPEFRDRIGRGQLKIAGVDLDGEVRIVELSDHPFYVATLFLPQVSSRPENPHPLIVAYLKAAQTVQTSGRRKIPAKCINGHG
jgi:CTP synthase (UTP-ammonia lyase)